MKLKFYLRGLGIGIAVTAVVLSVSGKGHTKELTDAQIKARAKELGMVEERLLSDVLDDDAEKEEQAKSTQEKSVGNNNSISENSSISNNLVGGETKASDDEQSIEKTADTIKKIAEDANPKEAEKKAITVESGESSASICKKLEKEGLIESASEFDQFLCQNGYDKRICTGEHSITKGATKEEIAKEITSR